MKTNQLFKNTLLSLIVMSMKISSFAQESAAFYKIQVGITTVITLSDGTVPLSAEKLFAANNMGKVKNLLHAAYIADPTETSINTFLVVSGNRLILIDTGSGELFGPKHGGAIVSSLRLAGYQPEQITDIFLTHIHNDHSGGLLVKGAPVFVNAIVHVNKLDFDYWLDEKRMEAADPNALASNKTSFVNAIKVFKPYIANQKVQTFIGKQELLPGITAIPAPGHTPGHTIFMLESRGEKILFCGDMVHMSSIQFADPKMIDGFDVDKKAAIRQRVKLYAEAAYEGYLIAGDHISYPGLGRLRKKAAGYDWFPVPYSVEGRTK